MLTKALFSLLLLVTIPAFAADPIPVQDPLPANFTILVNREALGSGVPGQAGLETNVYEFADGTLHVPQYLPGSPTAATIYPRVVDVDCTKTAEIVTCDGYHWTPNMGRAEYLLIHPRIVTPPAPVIQEKVITVIKEVPVKKKRE